MAPLPRAAAAGLFAGGAGTLLDHGPMNLIIAYWKQDLASFRRMWRGLQL